MLSFIKSLFGISEPPEQRQEMPTVTPDWKWAGYIASMIQGTIEDMGVAALQGTAVLVRRDDNGIEFRHHPRGDDSRQDWSADRTYTRYCYLRDCEELAAVIAAVELLGRNEDLIRMPVDILARSAANRLRQFRRPLAPLPPPKKVYDEDSDIPGLYLG